MDINAPLLGDLPKAEDGPAAADQVATELAKEVEEKATTNDA